MKRSVCDIVLGLCTFNGLSIRSDHMGFITLFIIAIGLSFDSFAVSVSSGVIRNRIIFIDATKIALSLAVFQGSMPLMGWLLGSSINRSIAAFDHWIAFGLLGFLGLRMVITGLRENREDAVMDPLKPMVLLSLSLATSIDAFVVGVSFAFLEVRMVIAGLVIGSVTFIASMVGILFGKKIGSHLSHRMEVVGGIILFAIGIKILIEHLFFDTQVAFLVDKFSTQMNSII